MADSPGRAGSGLRWSNWNLLLLVPLIILITPLTNFRGPAFLGMPFFYWSQLAFVIIGVLAVWVVYVKTRTPSNGDDQPDRLSVDDLDEGEAK
jgi:hypothetical protein